MEALFSRVYPAAFARRADAATRGARRGSSSGLTDGDGGMDAPYAKFEQVEPGIARVLAHNPSAFTYYGTQTYLAGEDEVAVIDPGPDLPEHLDALESAIAGRRVVAIMCTHTHRDHSPAARPLAERTGAPIVGCAPLALETVGPRADASFDGDYAPDRVLARRRGTRSRRQAHNRGRDAGAHLEPSLLRSWRRLVQRRPCHGLVDDRRRPARRRHGRLHAEPRQAQAARRPRLLSGARTRGDQTAAICPAPDGSPDAAREADPEAGR